MNAVPALAPEDMSFFCETIRARAGIAMKSSKADLVRTRLRERLAANGLSDYSAYRELLERLPESHPEWELFTNVLTTNKTDFFRESAHFDYLTETILPRWLKTGEKTFYAWSAASSTGEEIYTLAMVLARHLPADRTFRILGTDIDTDVLKVARNAVYSIDKLAQIPEAYRDFVDIGREAATGWFRIKPQLKDACSFQAHNLLERSVPGQDKFDLVLCRNVLIYFAPDTVQFIQDKLRVAVKTGGHLFIGHSESFQGLTHRWDSTAPSVFLKDKP